MNKRNLQGIFVRLTNEQHRLLKEKSKGSRISIAGLIRLAITKFLGGRL